MVVMFPMFQLARPTSRRKQPRLRKCFSCGLIAMRTAGAFPRRVALALYWPLSRATSETQVFIFIFFVRIIILIIYTLIDHI